MVHKEKDAGAGPAGAWIVIVNPPVLICIRGTPEWTLRSRNARVARPQLSTLAGTLLLGTPLRALHQTWDDAPEAARWR